MKRSLSKVSRLLQIQSLEARELLAGDLRIVELNYHPHAPLTQFGERDSDPDDFEFIEVMNSTYQANIRKAPISTMPGIPAP